MSTKKNSMFFPKTADDVRIATALQHYINAQLEDGVSQTDLIVAFETCLKSLETIHDPARHQQQSTNQLPISPEVSQILRRISRKARESLRRKAP